ncbi:MAG: hypothetical protein KTR32_05025 [Granulosicoccus sp.]|nr:hypothetical protein [Granulosicoccus sp.]
MSFRFNPLLNHPIVDAGNFPDAAWEGDLCNINGPSLIRVPSWVTDPLGRYYLYFAHHEGRSIRLAFADTLVGPWQYYAPGALTLENSLFCQRAPLPDETDPQVLASIAEGIDGDYPHIASPDIHVDSEKQEIRMYFHGRNPDGTQQTRLAVSHDGLSFSVLPALLGDSYFRVFRYQNADYAIAWGGRLYRSSDEGRHFQSGPLLTEQSYRHGAILSIGDEIFVLWSRAGDCPESILISRLITTNRDWQQWYLEQASLLHSPIAAWEGADLPLDSSSYGGIMQPVNQLRDPAIYVENHRVYLLYCIQGEQGIAIGELTKQS